MGNYEDVAERHDAEAAVVASQLERALAPLDRIQQQGHLVTSGAEVRAGLVRSLGRLGADAPRQKDVLPVAHVGAATSRR
ncbi:hypothetical protein OH764_32620 (plasmid) [Burkholderia sp. M6-3]